MGRLQDLMDRELRIRGYAENTRKCYIHYGFLANSVRRERIALCRRLLGVPTETAAPAHTESWEELLLRLTGKDVTRCPQCKAGHLHSTHEIRAGRSQGRIRCRGAPP